MLFFLSSVVTSQAEDESSTLVFNNHCRVKFSNERIANFMSRDEPTLQIVNFNEFIKFRIGERLLDNIFNFETTSYVLHNNLELPYGLSEGSLGCLLEHYFSYQVQFKEPDFSLINNYYKSNKILFQVNFILKIVKLLEEIINSKSELERFNTLDKELFELITSNSKKLNRIISDKILPDWTSVLSMIENQSLDIPKLTSLIDDYNILNFFDETNLADEKKCLISKKLISPLIQYNYSSDKINIINLLFEKIPECAKNDLHKNNIYPSTDTRYFSNWCLDEKARDKKKCMLYFNYSWRKSLGKCQKDSQCSSTQLTNLGTLYFNNENLESKKERDFFINRAQFFNSDQKSFYFPLNTPPVCRAKGCQPQIINCDPVILFNELINMQSKTNSQKCDKNEDCKLAYFSSKHIQHNLPFAISTEFYNLDNSYMTEIFDDMILDCKDKNGQSYINQDKIKEYLRQTKESATCEKNQCQMSN